MLTSDCTSHRHSESHSYLVVKSHRQDKQVPKTRNFILRPFTILIWRIYKILRNFVSLLNGWHRPRRWRRFFGFIFLLNFFMRELRLCAFTPWFSENFEIFRGLAEIVSDSIRLCSTMVTFFEWLNEKRLAPY